jgi:hypothetical protein
MSAATLHSTQAGTYAAGSTITLVCYERGQAVQGYFSNYVGNGGWDDLWYQVSDGFFVADIDIQTWSDNPITGACQTPPAQVQPAPAPVAPAPVVPAPAAPAPLAPVPLVSTPAAPPPASTSSTPNSSSSQGSTAAAPSSGASKYPDTPMSLPGPLLPRVPSGALFAQLYSYYYSKLGGDVRLDWSVFSNDSRLVAWAKNLKVNDYEDYSTDPTKEPDLTLSLHNMSVYRYSQHCYEIKDKYDFAFPYVPEMWDALVGKAKVFEIRSSGCLS